MATKRRRGETWHYTVRRSSLLPAPLYLSFDDEAAGDDYVARLEKLLDQGIVPDEFKKERRSQTTTLRAQVREYEAAQHVSNDDSECLRIATGRLPITLELKDLTFAWAAHWVSELKRVQNLAPGTIRHHVGALARCLDWVAAHGRLPFNPLRLLPKGYATYTPEDVREVKKVDGAAKLDNQRDRRLEKGEEPAIRAVLAGKKPKGRQRALELPEVDALVLLFEMGLETAMRMRESYTLTRDQVDFRKHTIFLDKTKNGSKRQVPMTTVIEQALRAYLAKHKGERVFPWWDGDRAPGELKKVTSRLSRQFDRIFTAAGCLDLNYHDLRHEATSRFFERTHMEPFEIMKITGHSDIKSLARYANLRGSKLSAKLW